MTCLVLQLSGKHNLNDPEEIGGQIPSSWRTAASQPADLNQEFSVLEMIRQI